MTNLITLIDDKKTEIRYIYHISDIHIRNTIDRKKEYQEIFTRLYENIKEDIGKNTKESLIILTGDIMHSKTDLSSDSVYAAGDFFENLSNITNVILILGNHDFNQSNSEQMDALTPIVDKICKIKTLFYLKDSALYQYYNIIFGVSSLLDHKLIKAELITTKMFNTIKQKNKYKIALYHGSLKGSKTDTGFVFKNTDLTIKDFDGYDYAMLGDVHKYQFVNSKKTIAYPGSLIQQSHGESLKNHGFLKWDILKCKTKFYEIQNDYGFCTVNIINGKMKKDTETEIPLKPNIKFILKDTNEIQYQKIYNELSKTHQIWKHTVQHEMKKIIFKNNSNSLNIMSESIQKDKIKEYLEQKELDNNQIKKIIKLHEKIQSKLQNNNENLMNNQKWRILELKFSNMLSFGENNIIDFRNYEPHQIIGIIAPNHYGKSSIVDIILFSLFDKCSRGERRDILNKNKKKMYCSLLFEIGNKQYIIERQGCISESNLSVKINVRFFIVHFDENNNMIKESLTGLEKNNTNKKICELIGSYDDYLATCICLQHQGKHGNFIDMTNHQKEEYLNDILKLNIFEKCFDDAKDKLNKLSGQVKTLEKDVKSKLSDDIDIKINNIENKIKKLELERYKINDDLLPPVDLTISTLKNPELIKYQELSKYQLNTEECILKTIDNLKHNIDTTDLNQINDQLIQYTNQFQKLKEKKRLIDENNNINDLRNEIEELYKQIITPPNKKLNIDDLQKEKETLQEELHEINDILETYPNENIDTDKPIKQLKNQIKNLKYSINYTKINPNSNDELDKLQNKYKTTQIELTNAYIKHLNNEYISEKEKDKLKIESSVKKNFAKHINSTIDELKLCVNHEKISEVLNKKLQTIISNENFWLEKYEN